MSNYWAEIRLQEQHAPLPAMCAALITQVNLLYAESKISKQAHSATADPNLPEEIEKKAVNTQMFVDVISDYVFSRMNAVPGLSTALDLSPILGNDAIPLYAYDLRVLLSIIAGFRFVFDQLLFLNAPVTVEEGRIIFRIAKGGFSELYFSQCKISELVEDHIMKSMVSKPPTYLPGECLDYKLVRNVDVTSGELSVDVNHASFEAKKSASFLMRSSIKTEYLFQTLESIPDGRNIHRTWDILHSLSKAMLEKADREKNLRLFDTVINHAYLTKIIVVSLGCSIRLIPLSQVAEFRRPRGARRRPDAYRWRSCVGGGSAVLASHPCGGSGGR